MAEEQQKTEEKPADDPKEQSEEASDDDGLTDAQRDASEHGWTPYQEYVDNGGDPDKYSGAQTFLTNYEAINRGRERDKEMGKMSGKIDRMSESFAKSMTAQETSIRKEYEAKKTEARKDEDFEAYEEADTELKRLDAREKDRDTPAGQEIHPVVADIVSKNPSIDKESDDYDPLMYGAVYGAVAAGIEGLGRDTTKSPPTDFELRHIMEGAIESAQERMNGSPPEKQGRKAPNIRTGGKKPAASTGKLDPQSQDVYDNFVENGLKDAAENFKKTRLEGAQA